jgi:L-iditol 2-dehydrogenase
MKVMPAAVLRGPHDLAVDERAVPVPGPDEVLVQVTSVGVCGSDVHYYEHGRIGPYVVERPLVLGHEPAGIVTAAGARVTRCRPGQRVSVEPGRPCFTCSMCLRGRYNLCPGMSFMATPPVDGAFCEYIVVHEAQAHPVPDSISDDAAALLEPLSVAIWACRRGGVTAGSRVLVNGAGPIGLMCTQVAVACGATDVIVADVNPYRLELAERFGATAIVEVPRMRLTGLDPDVLLECSGNPAATRSALEVVAPAGRAVLVGMGADEVTLPLSVLQAREVEVTGTFRYAGTWPTAIALAASGRVDLDGMVTGHFGLSEVEDALTAGAGDPRSVKPVVHPVRQR